MIKTEKEYQECLRRLERDTEHIEAMRRSFSAGKLSPNEIERALEPANSFHEQLREEVEWYERVKRRDIRPISNLTAVGPLLIALRLAADISQKELADRLNVDVSQVSRDEKNEYHGITLERAQRVLDALRGQVEIRLTSLENRALAPV
jgi:ribosome-binding protein aMBF1 (putative translation factor)